MKTKIVLVLILNASIMPAIADTVYRWTDPETGKIIVSPSRPRYPIKEIRNSEKLPDGYMIDVILDTNSPEVKAAIKKHEADEEIQLREKKRIAAQLAKEQAIKEAEERRLAEQQAIKEAEQKRIAAEQQAKESEQKRIAAEQQAKESEQKRIAAEQQLKEAEQRRIAEEKMRPFREAREKQIAEERVKKAEQESERRRIADEEIKRRSKEIEIIQRQSESEWKKFENSEKSTDIIVKSCAAEAGVPLVGSYTPTGNQWSSIMSCVDRKLGK